MKKDLSIKRRDYRAGFTLIELLVVIAIIAILASILFPVFARARENARRSSCQSNLKQIGLGILQYVQDYDERYPINGSPAVTEAGGWAYTIQPYVKSEQLLQCPSETSRAPVGNTTKERAADTGFTDYWYNYNLGPNSGPMSLSQITYPSNTVMNGDGDGAMSDYNKQWLGNGWPSFPSNHSSLRHLETANYLFTDGHVKALKPSVVLPGNTPSKTGGGASDCVGGPSTPTGSNVTFCGY
jgi:prepilin-type N-terminal cleavage/methylation domain-containing protein/prepilin-type processing-associated H-X9-DG protein